MKSKDDAHTTSLSKYQLAKMAAGLNSITLMNALTEIHLTSVALGISGQQFTAAETLKVLGRIGQRYAFIRPRRN